MRSHRGYGDRSRAYAHLSVSSKKNPRFHVPKDLLQGKKIEYFEYEACFSKNTAHPIIGKYNMIESEYITIKVKKKPGVTATCADPLPVYEGAPDVELSCAASGAPGSNPAYAYAWTARGATPDTGLLSATDIDKPKFDVPASVDQDETYEYLLTVSAPNAEDGKAEVTVKALNKPGIVVACADPDPVYEGSEDITLDCSPPTGAPGNAPDYAYAWTARGATPDTGLLSATDISSPVFYAPDEVDATTRYEYRVAVSAENADDATADVTVTVLNKGTLVLTCTDPAPVYEGSPDVALSCEASGAPEGSTYEYVWEARGAAADTDLLSATDVASPVFAVPDDVSQTTRYEYLLRVTALQAEDGSLDVTITVLNTGAISFACANPAPPRRTAGSRRRMSRAPKHLD